MMRPTRSYPTQNPFKESKSSPKEKTAGFQTMPFKAVAIVIIFTLSMSLAIYSAIYGDARPYFFLGPEPEKPGLNNSDHYYPTNISHIAFGIAGSIRTLPDRVHNLNLWWKPGVYRGFIFLEKKPEKQKPGEFLIQSKVSSDWRNFSQSGGSPKAAVRIARVVVDLFRSDLPDVRWFVMGDDDTVFFPENLAAVLDKYDHREMVYVGGCSESVEQDTKHAYNMAFGGGGFAVSYALTAQLVSAMDGCLRRYDHFYGSDQRVWACVAELGVELTRELGFHQMDIRGNPFGFLAAHPLAPLVSLHHINTLDPLFPHKTQLESLTHLLKAYKTDPSRILQQCFCYVRNHNWSVSVSWGYAVQVYPILLTATNLSTPLLTFKTWRTVRDGPFTFNTRYMSSNPCERPIVFYLDSANEGMDNDTLTRYKKFKNKPAKTCDGNNYASALAIRKIIVSAPKMDPNEWKQV